MYSSQKTEFRCFCAIKSNFKFPALATPNEIMLFVLWFCFRNINRDYKSQNELVFTQIRICTSVIHDFCGIYLNENTLSKFSDRSITGKFTNESSLFYPTPFLYMWFPADPPNHGCPSHRKVARVTSTSENITFKYFRWCGFAGRKTGQVGAKIEVINGNICGICHACHSLHYNLS